MYKRQALIQKESKQNIDRQNYVPVVIISGKISDLQALAMLKEIESMEEINKSVKQFRIHNAI